MLGTTASIEGIVHVIQVALTPIFLLSGIASLLGVFSGRLARVADRAHALTDRLETAEGAERSRLQRHLAYLHHRTRALDVAVVLGALAGGATCAAALLLFVGTLRDGTGAVFLFVAFGFGLLSTAAALTAFLVEMLMASRGIRDQVAEAETKDRDRPDASRSRAARVGRGPGGS